MATMKGKSSATDNTVFVRFVPSSANIRRHHLEDLFSQVGPIRKSSVIVPRAKNVDDNNESERPPASYGFIKYTAGEDAIAAASRFDHAALRISSTEVIKLRVERASDAAAAKANKKRTHQQRIEGEGDPTERQDGGQTPSVNKANRLIIRNLSFYAKETHVRKAMEPFGKVADVHIPQVPGGGKQNTHRGFCFVTFERGQDAKACLKALDIVIQKRSVSVAQALSKTMYENQKQPRNDRKNDRTASSPSTQDHGEEDMDAIEDGQEDKDSDREDLSDEESSGESSDDDDDDETENDGNSTANRDENAVTERRALFVRNLPFDATRHDLFELFRAFGYITGIFLVKDRDTGIPKGTAFVSYRSRDSVTKALEAARGGNDSFISQREETENQTMAGEKSHFTLKGRQIFINAALDKSTAETLVLEKSSDRHSSGKDRRNLYLKGEGRVDNDEENDKTPWDDLPEQDKSKRQRAWSEKNSKLRSPIFFINPTRISIRNLNKQIDEQEFKQLCVDATKRGLEKELVNAEDMIAHWRASGDMSTREIMAKVEAEGDSIVPAFDEKNVKRHIPSVFIDRDFSGSKKSAAPSRGFGFVEFESHAHALACLRELNNNIFYSEGFAAGGRHAIELRRKSKKRKGSKSMAAAAENDFVGVDGQVKVPRLIVEFAVENKAKARLQAEHRAQQQANKIKQKIENKEKQSKSDKKREKKKSRGARQRERKRLGLDKKAAGGTPNAETNDTTEKHTRSTVVEKSSQQDEGTKPVLAMKPKMAKPPKKKRKIDDEDAHFEKLVGSYKAKFAEAEVEGAVATDDEPRKQKKRWFED